MNGFEAMIEATKNEPYKKIGIWNCPYSYSVGEAKKTFPIRELLKPYWEVIENEVTE